MTAIEELRRSAARSYNINDLSNYVLLEGKDRPDILIADHRLTLSEALPRLDDKELIKILLKRSNGEQLDPEGFLGYLRHDEAGQVFSYNDEMFVPDTDQFAGLLRVLMSRKAFDGNSRNKISRLRAKGILDEIKEQRDPWRGEHLADSFKEKKGQMYAFNSRNKLEVPLDEDTLMEDRMISLEDWVKNPTKQGLPRNNVKSGNLSYEYPRDNTVAWFVADSDGAYLSCYEEPSYSNSSLGVRVARIKE